MNLGQQMTILGLVALVYYAVLLTAGVLSTDVMPQFLVSGLIFLSSGRLLRKAPRTRSPKLDKDGNPPKEPNWTLRTQILNWTMTFLIICILALWVMKPVGMTFMEMFHLK
ncbi:MAG: hypothetical protein QNK24_12515 [Desulfuromusa sp.]|nr:hypothetical protein [Desulfuromusa sp.]